MPFASVADAKSILARDASAFQIPSSEQEPDFEDQRQDSGFHKEPRISPKNQRFYLHRLQNL